MDDKPERDENTCAAIIRREMRLVSICPTRERTEFFVDSQWTWGHISATYVFYRVTVAVFVIAWATADFLVEAGRWYSYNYAIWLVFATNWSLVILGLSCVLMAISTTCCFVKVRCLRRDEREMRSQTIGPGLIFQWLVYIVAANVSIVVSISYWAFVVIIDRSDFFTTSMSQLKHTLTSVYIIVDLFVNSVPVRLLHFVYPLSIGIIYAIFNAAYFINDGIGPNGVHYAYYMLDWRNPLGSTLTCLLGFIVCILTQGLLFWFYRCRLWFHRKFISRIDEELRSVLPGNRGHDDEDLDTSPRASSSGNPIVTNYRSLNDLEERNG